MKLYLFIPANNITQGRKTEYLHLVSLMRQSDIEVLTNLDDSCEKYAEKFNREDKGAFLLNDMDAIIIDGSKPTSEIGYLVAFALSNKKPVLYLIERGLLLDASLRQLEREKRIIKLLNIYHYTDQSLEKIVRKFIEDITNGKVLKEVPNIKFTLRITASIDQYLDWKASQSRKTKADFLREIINDELIKGDEKYKKYLAEKPFS